MSIVMKCKMCGGDLIISAHASTAECAYCGSLQTVPLLNNQKKQSMFARANKLRALCDFDKAANIYESIAAEYPEESEAYWGLILCRYGIEYVTDPYTGRKTPTCHRASFSQVSEDPDLLQVFKYADSEALTLYIAEAKTIETLRKSILEVSRTEAPYDVFICYKETDENGDRTIDSVIAQDVFDALTAAGYRVFFSRICLEDKLGQEYEPYIFSALHSARVMLVFGTDYEYFHAVWVKNEWSRYMALIANGEKKTLIPCYKNIDAYDMPKEFIHLQGQNMGNVGAIQDLLRNINNIFSHQNASPAASQGVTRPQISSMLKHAYMKLEDKDWDKALCLFRDILETDEQNADAYLGIYMALEKMSDKDIMTKKYTCDQANMQGDNLKLAKKHATDEMRAWFAALDKQREEYLQRETRLRMQLCKNAKIAGQHIALGDCHAVCLKLDGSVVAFGNPAFSQCAVSDWKDIVAIVAGPMHTVGLKTNGTVVATGGNHFGELEVSSWKDIVSIATGYGLTAGIKSDGTVVLAGCDSHGEHQVSSLNDVTAIAIGEDHLVALRVDGTVRAFGSNLCKQLEVNEWRDIIAISAGRHSTVGLKSDGTVVATGKNLFNRLDVSEWRDIVAISTCDDFTLGLTKYGYVYTAGIQFRDSHSVDERDEWDTWEKEQKKFHAAPYVDDWEKIVTVSAGKGHAIGLTSDGEVVIRGENTHGQCNCEGMHLFQDVMTINQERRMILQAEQAALQSELSNLHGLFSILRRKKIETRLVELGEALKQNSAGEKEKQYVRNEV